MPKGRILKIKPGHEANCSSGMYAAFLMALGVYTLIPLMTITAIVHSLKADSISRRPLMDRKNLLYVIIPQCVGLLPVAVILGFSHGVLGAAAFVTAILGWWLAWLLGRRFIPKASEVLLAVATIAAVVAAGRILGLIPALHAAMGGAVVAAVSLSYRIAWRIGRRPPVFLLIVLAPVIGVALFAGMLFPVDPAFVLTRALQAGLYTPLPAIHDAAMRTDEETVRSLLDKGIDVNLKASGGLTALLVATGVNAVGIVGILLERGADPRIEDGERNTPLAVAASEGFTEVARLLLDKGADPNGTGKAGRTVLSEAAWSGHPEMVRLLLARGADANLAKGDGKTPLIEACSRWSHLSYGGKDGKGEAESDSNRQIRWEVRKERRNRTEIVRLLLENGAHVNPKEEDEETALMLASGYGHTEIVKLLLERGAEVNPQLRCYRFSPLSEASRAGYADTARLLLNNGATVPTELDDDKLTALGKASIEGYTEVVELLKAAGAKDLGPGFDTESWKTAVERKDLNRIEELLEHGFDVNARVFVLGKRTALMEASRYGKLDVVRLLLRKGADVNAKNENGETALSLAITDESAEVVELLKAHGARQ